MCYIEKSCVQHTVWRSAYFPCPASSILNSVFFLLEAQIALQLFILIATTKFKTFIQWQASLKCPTYIKKCIYMYINIPYIPYMCTYDSWWKPNFKVNKWLFFKLTAYFSKWIRMLQRKSSHGSNVVFRSILVKYFNGFSISAPLHSAEYTMKMHCITQKTKLKARNIYQCHFLAAAHSYAHCPTLQTTLLALQSPLTPNWQAGCCLQIYLGCSKKWSLRKKTQHKITFTNSDHIAKRATVLRSPSIYT